MEIQASDRLVSLVPRRRLWRSLVKKAEPEPTIEVAPGKTRVQWSIWGGSQHLALYKQIIDLFEAEHPEIEVQLVTVASFTDYLTKLQTLLAAGTPPDVISLGNEWFPAFMSKGAFADLTPFIRE